MKKFILAFLFFAAALPCFAGSFTDPRDGQTYKTVEIGGQVWMAQNLNYETRNSWCYDNNPENCRVGGRLYTWEAAKKACPSGWHLPSKTEFNTLLSHRNEVIPHSWRFNSGKNILSAYPVGRYTGKFKKFIRVKGAYFWSSTGAEHENDYAYYLDIRLKYANVNQFGIHKIDGVPIRCLRNSVTNEESAGNYSLPEKAVKESIEISPSSKKTDNDNSFTDSRDGQKYKTVKIGGQVWMAENLNYQTGYSWCYENNAANCKKYGRLYDWETANKVCPAGWHLPSKSEFETLVRAVGGGKNVAGKKLKSKSGWYNGGNGTDALGFAALPAGNYGGYDGNFGREGEHAYFWSSTEGNKNGAYDLLLREFAYVFIHYKYDGFSVRCLKNSNSTAESPREPVGGTPLSTESAAVGAVSLENEDGESFMDSRDGQKYRTVKIGKQVWMAQNLNYQTGNSWCYKNNAANCRKYGRLYDWKTAKKACPAGWHLPNDDEWNALWSAVGGENVAGKKLKSKSGWNNGGNGTDAFGFSVLPAGGHYYDGDSDDEGIYAYFWSASEGGSNDSYLWAFDYGTDYVDRNDRTKRYGLSVRCLRSSH